MYRAVVGAPDGSLDIAVLNPGKETLGYENVVDAGAVV